MSALSSRPAPAARGGCSATGNSARRPSIAARSSSSSSSTSARAAATTNTTIPDQQPLIAPPSRRAALLLLSAASAPLVLLPLAPRAAHANPLEDATRAYLRPSEGLTDEQAVAALMDARSTLRELAQLAATPSDSRERFEGRKLWPAFARWLRPAGPAAPRVVALALGGKDAEATLSARYGGAAAGSGAAAAAEAEAEAAASPSPSPSPSPSSSSQPRPLGDELYRSLGAVLTISGRTIREEAQVSPDRALRAAAAIDGVLERVPAPVKEGAMRLRVEERERRGR
jgi:hypothetical protein